MYMLIRHWFADHLSTATVEVRPLSHEPMVMCRAFPKAKNQAMTPCTGILLQASYSLHKGGTKTARINQGFQYSRISTVFCYSAIFILHFDMM